MSHRRNTWFYGLLIAMTSAAAALVIASRLGLAPESSAQTTGAPPMNSAPLTGPLSANTFRDVAKLVMPAVVNIRTESRQRAQDLSEFFGGGGGGATISSTVSSGSRSRVEVSRSRANRWCRPRARGSSSTRRASS